jgi:hypothetical protein
MQYFFQLFLIETYSQNTNKMACVRYLLLILLLSTTTSYTGVDLYRMLTTRPEDHMYPIFYTLTVVWCACGIISSLVCIHLIILKYLIARSDKRESDALLGGGVVPEDVKIHNWKESSKRHSQIFSFVLLAISCVGLIIDLCFYHLEGKRGDDMTRGIMITLDIMQIILFVFMYHMTLLSRD